jgi:ATP-binding protein involved in chromosome partitioning
MTVATEAEIRTALSHVQDPELRRSIVDLGMVRDLAIHEGTVTFTLALTIPGCPRRNQLSRDARAAVEALPGVGTWRQWRIPRSKEWLRRWAI